VSVNKVDPIIDLAPGADENSLATELSSRIRAHLEQQPKKVADFRGMRGAILVVAEDTAEIVTLRFDHGRLTVHDGTIGIPAVTFCAPRDTLLRLSDVPRVRWIKLPSPAAAFRNLIAPVAKGELKIYGLITRPRFILSFLRILSPHG
jgi:hypothetical protein